MSPPNVSTTMMTPGELQENSARIRRQLQRVSWGVPLALLLLIITIAVSFYQFRAKPLALERAEASQREAAEHMAAKLDGLASQVERVVLTLRGWVQDGVVKVDDPIGLNGVLIPVIKERSVVSSIHVANNEGREVLLLKAPEGWKNRITDVPRKGQKQNWLVWEDARRRVSEEWKDQDYDPRKRPWFTGAMGAPENKVFWTAPYMFQTTQEPGITAAIRWTDKSTGTQWVVALDVLLSDLSRVTLDLAYATHGQVALLTADGKVLGLPRNAGFTSEEAIKKAVLQDPAAIGLTVLAQALASGSVDVTATLGALMTVGGEDWRVRLQPQPLRNQQFRLALIAPQEDFAPWSRGFLATMAGVLLALMILCLAAARRLYTRVAEPIGSLFVQLASGNETLAAQGTETAILSELSAELQKAPTLAALGNSVLIGLSRHIAVGQGSLYLADEARQALTLCCGFARAEEAPLAHEIAYGEGLAGQCAVDRRGLVFDHPSPEHVRVMTTLGDARPVAILIEPVLHNNALLGVLELALLQPFSSKDRSILDNLLPTMAMSIEILERSASTQTLLDETQRQSQELANQKSIIEATEAWYRGIIESAPDGMLVTDETGTITLANPKLEAMFGYAKGELIGSPIEVLVPQAIRSEHVGLRDRYAESGENRSMGSISRELQGVRKDGSLFAVEVGLSRLPAVAGRGANVCASVRDITERKRLEQSMKDSEARLRQILENSPVGVSINNEGGIPTFSNRRVLELLGISEEVRATRSTRESWAHPPDRDAFLEVMHRDGKVTDYKADFVRTDGTPLTVLLSSMFMDLAEGRSLVTWIYDISEREKAQAALRMANFLNDQALDLTRAGHWHIPLNTGDEFYNSSERAATIFGDPPRPDWRYHLMNEWFVCVEAGDKDAAARTFENFNAALAGTVPRYDATYAYKRPVDGRVIWVHAMGHVVRDASGAPTDMYGVTVDVTETKLAEAKLEERMAELERFNTLTINREEKMIELKGEINDLRVQAGLPSKYKIVE